MQNLAVRAFLSGDAGTTEAVTNSLDTVLDNVTKVVSFSGDMLNVMLANPIYAFLFAVSFVGIGIGIVSLFRRGAHG